MQLCIQENVHSSRGSKIRHFRLRVCLFSASLITNDFIEFVYFGMNALIFWHFPSCIPPVQPLDSTHNKHLLSTYCMLGTMPWSAWWRGGHLPGLQVYLRKQPYAQNSLVHCDRKGMLEWEKLGVRNTNKKALVKVWIGYEMVSAKIICMEKGELGCTVMFTGRIWGWGGHTNNYLNASTGSTVDGDRSN